MLPAMPAVRTGKDYFDDLVIKIVKQIYQANPNLPKIDFATEEVPVSTPAEWEDYRTCLARIFPHNRSAGLAPRIVIYRLPIINRVRNRVEVEELLESLIVNYISDLTNLDPNSLIRKTKYSFFNE